ncbi:MAG TPA: C39 family peptidase, partial [Methylomirabilota bacterium]|nr:C39 family peptidase [Methylomirabilota bacterium]
DLLVVTGGLDAATLSSVVPPSCRRPAVAAPPPALEDGEAVLTLSPWTPRRPARHLLPSLSTLTDADHGFRFECSVAVDGQWSPWVAAASVGPGDFPTASTAAGPLVSEIDVFRASRPAEAVRLRVRLRAPDLAGVLRAPWLVTLSASDLDGDLPGPAACPARLAVPAVSQMEAAPAIARRVCSPASVAMVLGYWGRPVPVSRLAAEIFQPALDVYGVWPAAIRAAARHGVAGYLLRFPDWAAAAWCLGRGLPVIASVRYAAGELQGAAVEATDGHLLVLTGCEADDVLVNDPAAPSAAAVPRRYPLAQIQRVWLQRAGVGYVLFPPPPG